MSEIEIRRWCEGDLAATVELLWILNPETPVEILEGRWRAIRSEHPHHFALVAVVEGEIVGLAGAWVATKIWCGKYLEIDHLVVANSARCCGLGTRLITCLEELARECDCRVLVLDSYTSNHSSHRLYQRMGFEIWGFHFIKPIGDWRGTGE